MRSVQRSIFGFAVTVMLGLSPGHSRADDGVSIVKKMGAVCDINALVNSTVKQTKEGLKLVPVSIGEVGDLDCNLPGKPKKDIPLNREQYPTSPEFSTKVQESTSLDDSTIRIVVLSSQFGRLKIEYTVTSTKVNGFEHPSGDVTDVVIEPQYENSIVQFLNQ